MASCMNLPAEQAEYGVSVGHVRKVIKAVMARVGAISQKQKTGY